MTICLMFVLPPVLVFHYCHKKLKQAEAEVVQIYKLTFLKSEVSLSQSQDTSKAAFLLKAKGENPLTCGPT